MPYSDVIAPVTFRHVFTENFAPIRRFAYRRVLDEHLAEEIASQSLYLAWKRLEPADITRPWLLKTASHLIGDALRRRDRTRRLNEALVSIAMCHRGKDDLSHVVDAVHALPARDRDILLLRFWDDLDVVEIAGILGISGEAATKRLARARQRLAAELQSVGSGVKEAVMAHDVD